MSRCHIVLIAGCLIASGGPSLVADKKTGEKADPTIPQIMRAAHVAGGRPAKKTLDLKVASGRATEEERKELLSLYQALAKREPPGGSLTGWKTDTDALVAAAEAAVRGAPDAGDLLAAATNCKSCHDKYRYGRTVGLDQSVLSKTAPPEFATLAGVNRRSGYLIVYTVKTSPALSYHEQEIEREVEIDGRKERVKEKVKVPSLDLRRETVETVFSLDAKDSPAGATLYRLLDATGKELTGDERWKRLEPGQTLLLHQSPGPIDPAYLKPLAKDTLIIVPQPAGPAKR
jgi:hypothetical protein